MRHRAEGTARGALPNAHEMVVAAGDERLPVVGEGDAAHGFEMAKPERAESGDCVVRQWIADEVAALLERKEAKEEEESHAGIVRQSVRTISARPVT